MSTPCRPRPLSSSAPDVYALVAEAAANPGPELTADVELHAGQRPCTILTDNVST